MESRIIGLEDGTEPDLEASIIRKVLMRVPEAVATFKLPGYGVPCVTEPEYLKLLHEIRNPQPLEYAVFGPKDLTQVIIYPGGFPGFVRATDRPVLDMGVMGWFGSITVLQSLELPSGTVLGFTRDRVYSLTTKEDKPSK